MRCVSSGAAGLTRGKYYTLLSIKDGWAMVINDFGLEACFAQDRFRVVDAETLAEDAAWDRTAAAADPAGAHPIGAHSTIPPECRGHRQVILLVDDHANLRATTAEQLRRLNYLVVEAADADQALHCLRADPMIELLFTDIVMPGGMNGFDLARASRVLRPDLKILLTTGFSLARHGKGAAEQLGWPLIGKPYRMRELARHLAELLQGADAPDASNTNLVRETA